MLDKIFNNLPRILADYGASVIGSLIFLIAAWVFAHLIDALIRRLLRDRTDLDPSYIALTARAVRIVIMILASVAVLEGLGVEITSLIAALGIFGFAIALGLRTPLANFFTGMMIYILKPYDVGEHIEGERIDGVVEAIGTFHTVVVTGDGTHVSVPNAAMWARSIKNFSRPRPRRVDMSLTVGLEVPFETLRLAIEQAIEADPDTSFRYPPSIRIAESAEDVIRLTVSVWCEPEHVWAFGERLKKQLREAAAATGVTVKSVTVARRKRPAAKKQPPAAPPSADEAA